MATLQFTNEFQLSLIICPQSVTFDIENADDFDITIKSKA